MDEFSLYDEALNILDKDVLTQADFVELDRIIEDMVEVAEEESAWRGLAEVVELARMDPTNQVS
jgi:hypothetical protein